MAAIVNISTGSRFSESNQPRRLAVVPAPPALRLVHGGKSRSFQSMRRVYMFRRAAAFSMVIIALVLAFQVGSLLVGAFSSAEMAGVQSVGVSEQYTVRQGDTLWGIASAAVPNTDTRDVIDRLVELNSSSGTSFSPDEPLRVGQQIQLPQR